MEGCPQLKKKKKSYFIYYFVYARPVTYWLDLQGGLAENLNIFLLFWALDTLNFCPSFLKVNNNSIYYYIYILYQYRF